MFQAAAVIVAAGKSRRMGGGINKALAPLAGRPILSYALEAFHRSPLVQRIVVVGRDDDRAEIERVIAQYGPGANFTTGGAERSDSVLCGLEFFADDPPDAALIHDAARPFLEERFIADSLAALSEAPGCVIGVPMKDTLKEATSDARVVQTHDRSKFWLAQTPQTFRYAEILNAYRAVNPPPYPTDDGAALEAAGLVVKMIQGSNRNMKVTTPEDIHIAEALLAIKR